MTKLEKLIRKLLNNQSISYEEAEIILKRLGFEVNSRGSHHVFRKKGYLKNVCLKKRPQLISYQLRMLQEVLKDHGY